MQEKRAAVGLVFAVAFAVAGCGSPEVPRERGIGFDAYSQEQRERALIEERRLAQQASIIPPPQVNVVAGSDPAETVPLATLLAAAAANTAKAPAAQTEQTPAPSPAVTPTALPEAAPAAAPQTAPSAAAAPLTTIATTALPPAGVSGASARSTAPGSAAGDDPLRTQGVQASPNNPAPQLVGALGGLSDEQSFDAVAGRETIESDAERRAAQAAARTQIAPTALPDRPETTGPNIVQFALNAPNAKGQVMFNRSILVTERRARRNCALYPTAEDAQRDFLSRGGPERDRRSLDPDGDGFACDWDPAPYIAAVRN